MNEGKDLRNKIVLYQGYFYSIGGNSCSAEKFYIKKNEWRLIESYSKYVVDNLDSWSCAFSFENFNRYPKFKPNF